jgi:hypothetical protein
MKTLWKYAALCALALLSFSCEKEKGGIIDPPLDLPYLVSLTTSPGRVNLDSIVAVPAGGGAATYDVKVSVSGSASAAGASTLSQINYRIYEPGSNTAIKSGSVHFTTNAGAATFNDSLTFSVTRNDIGTFRIELIAKDAGGASSNALLSSIFITRTNSRPRLLNLEAPDTLQRPAQGQAAKYLSFAVAGADSDGYDDISSIKFKRVSPVDPSNTEFTMFDDGDYLAHRDVTAGDGIFSSGIQITSSARLGDFVFLFLAFDKSGAVSDSLTHQVTVIP